MLQHRALLPLVLSLAIAGPALFAQDQPAKRGRKYKAPPETAKISVTVVRDSNGKPIENAAVVFHPMVGEKDDGNMELKTNDEGKTTIDVIPLGDTVRLQIIAKGFQTFGDDFKVDKNEIAIDVRMKRPGEQYSIYKDHPAGTLGGKDQPDKAQPDKAQPKDGADSAKPDSGSKPQN